MAEVVETTSRTAVEAMKRLGGTPLAEYVDDTGRTVYRIRPRPRPASPPPALSSPSKRFRARSAGRPHSLSQPPLPSHALELLPDAGPSRLLHPARSIPGLRSHVTSIMPDASGFYRAPDDKALTPAQRAASMPAASHSSFQAMCEGGDVLGRLLGWAPSTSPAPDADLPADLVDELNASASASTSTPITPTMPDAPTLARPSPRTPLTRNASADNVRVSPFGDGVRGQSRRLRRVRSGEDGPPSPSPTPDHSPEGSRTPTSQLVLDGGGPAPRMREAISSETIRDSGSSFTPAPPPEPSPAPLPYASTAIFDAFQTLERAPPTPTWPTHARNGSTSSLVSTASIQTAHGITVTSTATDDPRFVIWGQRNDARASMSRAATPSSDPGGKRWSARGRRTSAADVPLPGSPASVGSETSSSSVSGRILLAATVERWVAELTSKIDDDLLTDFFLTYRALLSSVSLLRLLAARFAWGLEAPSSPEDEAGRRIVRVRTFVVVRHWLLNYFADDFARDRTLRSALCDWLNTTGKDPRLKDSPKDQQLIKSLKKVVRRLKEQYGPSSIIGRAIAANIAYTDAPPVLPPLKTEAVHAQGPVRMPSEPALGSVPESPRAMDMPVLAPAIVLDDDVDLEIELLVEGEGAADPSAPSSPKQLFVPVSPPRPPRSRSPSNSPTSPSKRHSQLPSSSTIVGRTVTGTLGSFGRFKRMLKDRSASEEADPALASDLLCQTGGSRPSSDGRTQFDQEQFRSYMRSYELRVPGGSDATSSTSPTSDDGLDTPGDSSDVGIVIETDPDNEDTARLPDDGGGLGISGVVLHHSASSQTIKSDVSIRGAQVKKRKSRLDGGLRALFNAGSSGRARVASVQLDDLSDDGGDSSENEDYGVVQRTLRRLPNARDLRHVMDIRRLTPASMRRNSVDTVSSYGAPRTGSPSGTLLRPRQSMRRATAEPAPVLVIQGFVPDGLDSDDDEPGDVEAALRRLEGQIDTDKQMENARKVETQLGKSAAFLAGTYRPRQRISIASSSDADADEARSERGDPDESIASSPSESARRSVVSPAPSPVPPPLPSVVIQAVPTIAHPVKAPKRKPSVRRFFTLPRPGSSLSHHRAPTPAQPPPLLPHHHCFILHVKTELVAQQLCLIERDLLSNISWHELVAGSWRDRTGQTDVLDWEAFLKLRARQMVEAKARGERVMLDEVQAAIARFNLVANWVGSEIVMTLALEERAALVSKFIRLAFKCYRQNNFQTLTQIVHGLQLAAVERLRATWSRVGSWELRVFRDLKAFTSHLRNFRSLRAATDALIGDWVPPALTSATSSAMPSRTGSTRNSISFRTSPLVIGQAQASGCIPFLGLFLRDLAISAELPTWLDPSAPNSAVSAAVDPATGALVRLAHPAEFDRLPALPPSVLPLKALVNIHKHRTLAGVVQKVLVCTEMASVYPFEPEPTLYRKCLALRCLPPDALISFSLQCER